MTHISSALNGEISHTFHVFFPPKDLVGTQVGRWSWDVDVASRKHMRMIWETMVNNKNNNYLYVMIWDDVGWYLLKSLKDRTFCSKIGLAGDANPRTPAKGRAKHGSHFDGGTLAYYPKMVRTVRSSIMCWVFMILLRSAENCVELFVMSIQGWVTLTTSWEGYPLTWWQLMMDY